MNARKQTKNDESHTSERGFYVYCVGERAALEPLFDAALPAPVEADASLELIADDALAAVCSVVALTDYGEEALQARLADATWTAVRAMRHERVVEHFARRASVVPLRFGTIYLARGGVEQMLAERRAELQGIIERLRGREEWCVNVYCDRAKLSAQLVLLSPRLRELSEQAARATPGQSYLLQKKIETL
ncbi:MAG TPA: GvpL/GvpF family gas vesicle protein, partial [Pyrinomonadaceae bacterium]|nr:GvpL/GvpF family gas vesicle protein [Pyrinomonadaceae bacterium]